MRNEAGVSVTSMKAFQMHYEQLGRVSVNSDFEFEWKEVVERKVSMCSSVSEVWRMKGNRERRNCEVYLKAKK